MSTTATPPLEHRPTLSRVHHLKLAVSKLDVSLVWYERVLGAQHIVELDQYRERRCAIVCELLDLYIELREDPVQAAKDRGWNLVTFLTQGYDDLAAWHAWLSGWGTPHSNVLVGPRGWVLAFSDPDGRHFQIWTQDRHNGLEPSIDKDWLSDVS